MPFSTLPARSSRTRRWRASTSFNFPADYPVVNRIYGSYFKAGRYPARTTVGVTHLALGGKVEIDLIVKL